MALKLQDINEVIKILKESKSNEEICKAITCLRRNHVEKLNSYDENDLEKLCAVLVKLSVSDDEKIHMETWRTLDTVIPKIKNFDFLQLAMPIRKKRLKVFEYLAIQKEEVVAIIVNKPSVTDFLNDCFQFVQPKTMKWISPENVENKELLKTADNRTLSPEEEFEEKIIEKSLNFLQNLYKIPVSNVEQFDSIVMSKIIPLAYMGQRKFRKLSLTILNQAIFYKLGDRVRTNMKDIWEEYKITLQNTYCKRMSLLVAEGEHDWHIQWSTSIRFISTDLHKGSGLVNSLLKVEELAFKSSDIIRRQAFISWKLLIENFSLDPQELSSPRRIKLLCIPLNAKNCKTEALVLTKFEVWWHLIYKLHPNLNKFIDTILKPFFNFCFGPITDKPSLNQNSENSAVAKKYSKAQLYIIDSFIQLLLEKKEHPKNKFLKLEEKLSEPVNQKTFQEMHKNFIYGFGEIVFILSSMPEQDLEAKQNICKTLWNSIVKKIAFCDDKIKVNIYKEVVNVINELFTCNKVLIKDLLLDVILYNINTITSHLNYSDCNLLQIFLSFISSSNFLYLNKNHCQSIEQLLGQIIKSKSLTYNPQTLEIVASVVDILQESKKNKSYTLMVCKIWCISAKILKNYIEDSQNINESKTLEHNFKTIENFIEFPFSIANLDDESEITNMANSWKAIYEQFDLQTGLIITVKPNEILHKTCDTISSWLKKNNNCSDFAVLCSEVLLETVNYDHINTDYVLSFVELIKNLTVQSVSKSSFVSENILKILSTFLLNVNTHDQNRVHEFVKLFEPAVKCMLTTCAEPDVENQIASCWNTIVGMIKNLHSRSILNYDLLSAYQQIIVQACTHLNSSISSQGFQVLELTNNLDDKSRRLLESIKNESSVISKTNISAQNVRIQDRKEKNKPSKSVNSYLNRKSLSPSIKTITSSQNEKENIGKKKIFFEPDSQDFVAIDSNVKYDVNFLTEHQKELMKKRRDDIPALYNELSKSCSQDTQEIQKWFDNNLGKDNSKAKAETVPISSTNIKDVKSKKSQDKANFNTEISNQDNSKSSNKKQNSGKSITKVNAQKNNNEKIGMAVNVQPGSEKNVFEFPKKNIEEKLSDQTDKNMQEKEKNLPSTRVRRSKIQKFPSADQLQKRGIKRRISDSSSEEISTSTREKRSRQSPEILNSSGESNNSKDSDKTDESNLSKRQKNEMLRLQIDMVDFPPQITGRRSAVLKTNSQEEKLQEPTKKRHRSSIKENENKPIDSDLQVINIPEKIQVSSSHQENGKKRNRRSAKMNNDKDENAILNIQESIKTEIKSWATIQEPDDSTQDIQIEEILTQEKSPKSQEDKDHQIESCDTFTVSQDSDIVESSQEPSCMSKLDKICKDKKCIIKINKMTSVQSENMGPNEATCSEQKENTLAIKGTNDHDINADAKDSLKIDSVIKTPSGTPNTNSPKTSKPRKSFTMGRAAHMLGLVTKQSLAEKLESKDPEEISIIPLTKKDKISAPKDFDKASTSCGGSRQEKIFNKMNNKKVKENCSSPSIKMFFNLRNDEENTLHKLDKTLENTSSFEGDNKNDQDVAEVYNENSPIPKKRELPILEWSTTNPDLTASPSASILKRHAQMLQEQDDTPNRKKRVSFADPAVSKEMCYHIEYDANDVMSPSRLNKLPSLTSPKSRKDLMLRPKRSKPLVIQLETENVDEQDLNQVNQVEIIKKIDSVSIPINKEQENTNEGEQILKPSNEITARLKLTQVISELDLKEKEQTDNIITETQEDIFENMEYMNDITTKVIKINVPLIEKNDLSMNNSITLDSIKLDTITTNISQKNDNPPALEDTVDINNCTNLTSLNSTSNSEELFGKPMSTSTQQQFNEQDTLPVTDSIFSNAPSSQDTQASSLSIVHLPQPEALDSTLPIYPSLISCQDPIKPIAKELTNPLWTSRLTNLFSDRGIDSIGKLAQLSEREIERMPIKGSPKTAQVKKVLTKYEFSKKEEKTTPEKMMNVSSSTPIKDKSKVIENEAKSKSLEKAKLNISFEDPVKQQNNSIDLGSPLGKKTLKRQLVDISLQTSPAKKKFVSSATEIDEILDNCDVDILLDRMFERYSSKEILQKYKNKFESQNNKQMKKDIYSLLGIKLDDVSKNMQKLLLNISENFNEYKFLESAFDLYKDKLTVNDLVTLLKVLPKEDLMDAILKAPITTQNALLDAIPDFINEKLAITEKKQDILQKIQVILMKIPAKDCLDLFYNSMNNFLDKKS